MAGYSTNGVFTAGICEKILSNLSNHTMAANLQSTKRSNLGYLNFLKSPLNNSGVQVIPVQNDSKRKQVRILYKQRTVDSEVTTSEDGNCTPERYPDFLETTFNVDSVVSYNFGLKKREATLVCDGGNDSLIMSEINETFDALSRKLNSQLLSKQLLNFGYNYGNTTPSASVKSLAALGTNGVPLASFIQTLITDYSEKNEYYGNPAIIGGGNVMKYFNTTMTGCCNADGVDHFALAGKLGFAPFLDTMASTTLGTDQFIVMAPGMVQLVPFNRYVGENAGQFGTSVDTTITDPVTGITYDMKVDYDGCNETFYVRLTLNYGLWIPPVDTYNPADPLYRTNGTARYAATAS
jgi:hypothetical protein